MPSCLLREKVDFAAAGGPRGCSHPALGLRPRSGLGASNQTPGGPSGSPALSMVGTEKTDSFTKFRKSTRLQVKRRMEAAES
jgi:hypothetical protein